MRGKTSIPSYIPASVAALISCSCYVSYVCICTLIQNTCQFSSHQPQHKRKNMLLFKSSGNSLCVLMLCWQVWVGEGCDENWTQEAKLSSHLESPSQNISAVGFLSDYKNNVQAMLGCCVNYIVCRLDQ